MGLINFTYDSVVTGDFELLEVFAGDIPIDHDNGVIHFQGEIEEGDIMIITYRFVAPVGTAFEIEYSCKDDNTTDTYEDQENPSVVSTRLISGGFLEETLNIKMER